ncbi:MAG: hypothetical protein ACQETI_02550 [Halobacteriota archaeon]
MFRTNHLSSREESDSEPDSGTGLDFEDLTRWLRLLRLLLGIVVSLLTALKLLGVL